MKPEMFYVGKILLMIIAVTVFFKGGVWAAIKRLVARWMIKLRLYIDVKWNKSDKCIFTEARWDEEGKKIVRLVCGPHGEKLPGHVTGGQYDHARIVVHPGDMILTASWDHYEHNKKIEFGTVLIAYRIEQLGKIGANVKPIAQRIYDSQGRMIDNNIPNELEEVVDAAIRKLNSKSDEPVWITTSI